MSDLLNSAVLKERAPLLSAHLILNVAIIPVFRKPVVRLPPNLVRLTPIVQLATTAQVILLLPVSLFLLSLALLQLSVKLMGSSMFAKMHSVHPYCPCLVLEMRNVL